MNDAWIEFCEKENKNRINELKKKNKRIGRKYKRKRNKKFQNGRI